jgi:hypothetical protein
MQNEEITTLNELDKVIKKFKTQKHQEKRALLQSYVSMHLKTFYSDH